MRKIFSFILIALFYNSCNIEALKGDVFTGEWVLSRSSPNYSLGEIKNITVKITKEDIFYMVDYIIDGKNIFADMATEIDKNKSGEQLIKDNYRKYQLSPDKRMLISVMFSTEYLIVYNDDSKTITTQFGWFKKK